MVFFLSSDISFVFKPVVIYLEKQVGVSLKKREHFIFAFFLMVVNNLPLGMSILQKKEDIFSDCRKKFWNTYKVRQAIIYLPRKQTKKYHKPFEIFLPPTAFLSLHYLFICKEALSTSSLVKSG